MRILTAGKTSESDYTDASIKALKNGAHLQDKDRFDSHKIFLRKMANTLSKSGSSATSGTTS
jgi:hypothetical protein